MNLSPEWVRTLHEQGREAVHWSAVGDPRATDREIMDWAAAHGRVVFTHDLDFGTMLALSHRAGPSVIQVRAKNVLPDHMKGPVIAALDQHEASGGAYGSPRVHAQLRRDGLMVSEKSVEAARNPHPDLKRGEPPNHRMQWKHPTGAPPLTSLNAKHPPNPGDRVPAVSLRLALLLSGIMKSMVPSASKTHCFDFDHERRQPSLPRLVV